ncbi:hypothetical protein BOTBODRAFT_58978 [Botryobasidium botryosum FD-172 SS1]|uniref:F-box domain-containing protein n=1 Tax=Botryobasidium botryosum (strain FD-172 SS1) TaxID=930990 RepID=A0A067M075_BOTB1|nr:hypothetical protein BOTBODRAFT_58978 [Botryobasidium botryosum FD-172 SS1]
MSPPTLPYDVLLSVISLMACTRPRSLVNMACTSRKMRDIIIPRFLYSHITISDESNCLETLLQAFCTSRASHVDSVRSLSINCVITRSAQLLLVEVLSTMRNLREIRLSNASKFTEAQAIAAIGPMTHLRSLHILHFTFSTFDRAAERLAELRSLRLEGYTYHLTQLTPRWDGKAISNSRGTLEQLCLGYVSWDLRIGPVGIWPRLQTLDLRDTYVFGMEDLDLSTSFPLVRSFGPPLNDPHTWAPLPCNLPFLSNLESFQGSVNVLEVARPMLSNLRFLLAQHWGVQAITECDRFVPPSLQLLRLELWTKGAIVPQTFGVIAEAAPNLAFLSIYWHVALTHRCVLGIAEALIAFLPRLPLSYVKINCHNVTHGPRDKRLAESTLGAAWERAVNLASSLDSMKAFDLQIGSCEIHWRRDAIEEDSPYEQYLEFVHRIHSPLAMAIGPHPGVPP